MLLRSSSTPVLEYLLAPLVSCHAEPSADHIKNESLAGEAVLPKSLAFSTRGSPSCLLTNCLSNFDPHLQKSNGGCLPLRCMRKVLSENDLCSLASGSSLSPAQVAANSLLHDDNADCSDLDLVVSRSHVPHVEKGRTALLLSRWRSLGSIPSKVFFDSDSAILEEVESASSDSSATNEEGEERGESICVSDKLAFPVGNALNAKGERDVGDASNAKVDRIIDTANVGFELNMVDDAGLYKSTSDKQGVGGVERGLEMNPSKHSVDASFSGREEPRYFVGQGTSCLFEGREGATGTTVLVPHVHGQASQPKYAYQGSPWELALGAGDGGRGARPPTSTGRGGGGGEAGGHGGRNYDPTELRYQSILKNDPGHALILQNYAQYLTEVKHDHRKAEEFFQRAILANPSDGELLGQYAKMLWEVKQDRERAATYFERSVQAAPDNSYVMAAYASFLWSADEEEEEESVEEGKGSSPANVPAGLFSLVSVGLA